MAKFFVPPESVTGETALIKGKEAHHILDVLRLQKGDLIQTFDGTGKVYQAEIIQAKDKQVKLKINSVLAQKKIRSVNIALVQALPKKQKIEFIIEKCTELGVDLIIPAQTARTVVRLDQKKAGARHLRWRRIAEQAAQQSGRTTIPQIEKLKFWPEVLGLLSDFDLKLLACLSPQTKPLQQVLRSQNKIKKVALLIGPEGDFTPAEITQAQAAGCIAVSLGNNVLKTDTAAVAALAILNYELQSG